MPLWKIIFVASETSSRACDLRGRRCTTRLKDTFSQLSINSSWQQWQENCVIYLSACALNFLSVSAVHHRGAFVTVDCAARAQISAAKYIRNKESLVIVHECARGSLSCCCLPRALLLLLLRRRSYSSSHCVVNEKMKL